MKLQDLLEHQDQLNARLDAIEGEKAQIVRKLRAIDVLLEGDAAGPPSRPPGRPPGRTPGRAQGAEPKALTVPQQVSAAVKRKRGVSPHAVRVSSRSSLIDAVHQVALKQLAEFDSGQLLKALQAEYPEFKLTETKHISSPLSDLVKRGALVIERKRVGNIPNIYRAVGAGSKNS